MKSNTFKNLEQLCYAKGIVCERTGKKIEMTTPDGGTMAQCATVSEGFDILQNDPTFSQLPIKQPRAMPDIIRTGWKDSIVQAQRHNPFSA